MSKQTISIGNQPNDGSGDSLRNAFKKVNENFDEVYDHQIIVDNDPLLTNNSAANVASQQAIKTYIDTQLFSIDETIIEAVDSMTNTVIDVVESSVTDTVNETIDDAVVTLNNYTDSRVNSAIIILNTEIVTGFNNSINELMAQNSELFEETISDLASDANTRINNAVSIINNSANSTLNSISISANNTLSNIPNIISDEIDTRIDGIVETVTDDLFLDSKRVTIANTGTPLTAENIHDAIIELFGRIDNVVLLPNETDAREIKTTGHYQLTSGVGTPWDNTWLIEVFAMPNGNVIQKFTDADRQYGWVNKNRQFVASADAWGDWQSLQAANDVYYSNSTSGLSAYNLQMAIDELAAQIANL